jgi:hypothetical protein
MPQGPWLSLCVESGLPLPIDLLDLVVPSADISDCGSELEVLSSQLSDVLSAPTGGFAASLGPKHHTDPRSQTSSRFSLRLKLLELSRQQRPSISGEAGAGLRDWQGSQSFGTMRGGNCGGALLKAVDGLRRAVDLAWVQQGYIHRLYGLLHPEQEQGRRGQLPSIQNCRALKASRVYFVDFISRFLLAL